MSDDLVKGLRAIDKDIILRRFDPEMSFDGMTAHKAADHIEKLEAELHSCFHRIEELQAALREITSVSKVYVANGEDMAQALLTLLHSHRKIALAALEGKDE